MSWRDRFRPGSYRGVPFNIDSGTDRRSRRVVVHTFPAKDKPFIEDLGKNPTGFTIEAFLIGDDYLEQRDALQDACMKAGPGKLIHPFYGELFVQCESIDTTTVKEEMRMLRVSMVFHEVEETQKPIVQVIATASKVEFDARAVVESQKTLFEQAFDFASVPFAQAQAVKEEIGKGIEAVVAAKKVVEMGPAFAKNVQDIGSNIETLLLNAEELADSIIELITLGFLTEDFDADGTPDIAQSFIGLSELFNHSSSSNISSDEARSFANLIRGIALAQGAHLLSLGEFKSLEDAKDKRDILYAALDSYLSSGIADNLYLAMLAMRASVENDFSERAASLPRIIEMTLPDFFPALVLSYRLYGNTDFEEDIIQRNRIAHPGILPSDVPIKVLSRG